MRHLIAVLLIVAGCSTAEPPAAQAPVPVEPPKAAKPTTVKFDVGGLKIGDPLTKEFAHEHFPARDKDKTDVDWNQRVILNGAKLFVTHKFRNSDLAGVSMIFESELYPQMLKTYTEKFGCPPHKTLSTNFTTKDGVSRQNEIAYWRTDAGLFSLHRFSIDTFWGGGILRTASDQQESDESPDKESLPQL